MDTNEKNLSTCKICSQIKLKIQDGKFDNNNKRWRDERGGLWVGRTCPDCHRRKMAEHQKLKRNGNV